MAKLTRKLWVGIGAASVAGASLAGAAAQNAHHQGLSAAQTPPAGQGVATSNPADGGEAYLADGGPRDPRIGFYRDIGLIRGHLLVGRQLIEQDLWDEALPHFLHPTEELYGRLEKSIALHRMRPFRLELIALAQAVKAKRSGAYRQALMVVEQRLTGALDVATTFMRPLPSFTVKAAAEMLKVALSEYETSIADAAFRNPVEYQDGRGFVWEAERMLEGAAPQLAKTDADALAKIRADLERLKRAWPAPMPPAAPLLEPAQMTLLISNIALNCQRF
jgi:hypothetical protein